MVWKRLYEIIYQGVQENFIIPNVTIFCVQTKVFSNIKVCVLIITPFVNQSAIFFSAVLQQVKKIQENL